MQHAAASPAVLVEPPDDTPTMADALDGQFDYTVTDTAHDRRITHISRFSRTAQLHGEDMNKWSPDIRLNMAITLETMPAFVPTPEGVAVMLAARQVARRLRMPVRASSRPVISPSATPMSRAPRQSRSRAHRSRRVRATSSSSSDSSDSAPPAPSHPAEHCCQLQGRDEFDGSTTSTSQLTTGFVRLGCGTLAEIGSAVLPSQARDRGGAR